jgi:hypothetical protein
MRIYAASLSVLSFSLQVSSLKPLVHAEYTVDLV